MPEAYRETPISRRRFSTLLTAVIVVLSTVSVITILVVLGSHFNVGVEREYRKKLRHKKVRSRSDCRIDLPTSRIDCVIWRKKTRCG